MHALAERIKKDSWKATVLTAPKKYLNFRGVGFCGGQPVATSDKGALWWPEGAEKKPKPIEVEGLKHLGVLRAKGRQMACFADRTGPVLLTLDKDGALKHTLLHPAGYKTSMVLGCGAETQVGNGYPENDPENFHALLWNGTAERVVALQGSKPGVGCSASGADTNLQAGYWNGGTCMGMSAKHACIWRGSSETFLDLHPVSAGSSLLYAAADEEQVGEHFGPELNGPLAGLWRGSAESFVNLTPVGFRIAQARGCAGGFQVGMMMEKARYFSRAVLWNGCATDYFELHTLVPPEWNWSEALEIYIEGDVLRVIGTLRKGVLHVRHQEVLQHSAEGAMVWEARLSAPVARTESAASAAPVTQPVQVATSKPEFGESYERCAGAFADAIIAKDFKKAAEFLAPWLKKDFTPTKLKKLVAEALFEDAPEPGEVDVQKMGAEEGAAMLKTLRSESLGHPTQEISAEITPENYRAWLCLEFLPDAEAETDLDYVYRLWVIVVELPGGMKIGYLEAFDE